MIERAMTNDSITIPQYKKRLYAREQKLELKAHRSMQALKRKKEYVARHGKELISDEVVGKVSGSSPLFGKIASMLLGKSNKKRLNIGAQQSILDKNEYPNSSSSLFSKMGSAIIPLIYTIGERKLLSYSLKGAGKLIRFTLRNLFGLKRKRRGR